MTGYGADINLIKWNWETGGQMQLHIYLLFIASKFNWEQNFIIWFSISPDTPHPLPCPSTSAYLCVCCGSTIITRTTTTTREIYCAIYDGAQLLWDCHKSNKYGCPIECVFVHCCSFPPLFRTISVSVCACLRISSFRIARIPFYPLLFFPLWHFFVVCPALSFTFLFSVFYFCRWALFKFPVY